MDPNTNSNFWSQPVDQDALNLTHAIALTESGGKTGKPDYSAVGDAGTSKGAYQWQPGNYAAAAKEAGLNPDDFSPTTQDKVAYYQVKKYKDQGYDPGQIGSLWNSGSADNWKDHKGSKVINGQVVEYDTPGYVQRLKSNYQTLQTQRQQSAVLPQTQTPAGPPAAEAATGLTTDNQEAGGAGNGIVDGVKAVGNFLFPIAGDLYHDVKGDSSKTGLQQLGDAGLSALPFIPGLGEVGEGARAAELGVEGASKVGLASKLLGTAAKKGAAVGYGAGVSQNLASGKSIGESVNPLDLTNVLSTATGGIAGKYIPKLAGKIAENTTQHGALRAVQDNLHEELLRTVPGRNLAGNLPERGSRAVAIIAKSGALPEVEGTHYNVEEGINKLYGNIAQLGQARAAAIDKIAAPVALSDLKEEALAHSVGEQEGASAAAKSNAGRNVFSTQAGKTQQGIEDYFDTLEKRLGRPEITASELEQLKEKLTEESGIYKQTGAIADRNTASFIADAARNKMEKMADSAGFSGMKEYNQVMRDHYDAIKVLQRVGRHVVRGGRLGNMLREHAIGLASSAGAAALGGGFVGTLGALFGGEMAGKGLSKILSETSITNPLRDAIIEKMESQDPAAVEKLKEFIGREESVAPQKVATPAKRGGLVPSALLKGAIRGATAAGSLAGQ